MMLLGFAILIIAALLIFGSLWWFLAKFLKLSPKQKKRILFVTLLFALLLIGAYWVRQTYFVSPFDRWVRRAEHADFTIWGDEPRPNAVKYYGKALEVWSPTDGVRKKFDALVMRADLLRLQGGQQEAILDYTKAIELNPDDLRPVEGRGLAFSATKEYDKAISDFTKTIELGGRFGWPFEWMHHSTNGDEIFYARGMARYEQGDFQKAILDSSEAIKREPLTDVYYRLRGLSENRLRRYSDAIQDLTQCIQVATAHGAGPHEADYRERGYAYNKIGRYQYAVEDLTKSIEKHHSYYPESFDYHERGWAYDQLGQHDKARQDYEMAQRYKPWSFVKNLDPS